MNQALNDQACGRRRPIATAIDDCRQRRTPVRRTSHRAKCWRISMPATRQQRYGNRWSINGLPGALMAEAAGGSAASWLEVSPVLRAIGYWSAPLALSETMLASLLLAHAGLQVPEGPITLIQIGHLGDLRLDRGWPS